MDIDTDDAFRSFLPGQKADDSSCYAEFYLDKKLLAARSREAGREIYEDREHVKIYVKGQDKQIFVREVTDEDRRRFPNAYAAFRAGAEPPAFGTPLDVLGVPPSQRTALAIKHVRTVEDIAALSDEAIANLGIMGARDLQVKAKALIEKSSAQTIKLEQQLGEEKARSDAMQKQLAEMQEQMAQLLARKKPGRPKVQT